MEGWKRTKVKKQNVKNEEMLRMSSSTRRVTFFRIEIDIYTASTDEKSKSIYMISIIKTNVEKTYFLVSKKKKKNGEAMGWR